MCQRCYFRAVQRRLAQAVAALVMATSALASLTNPAQAITFPDATYIPASEAPWMVSIWQTNTHFDRRVDGYACGGVLIDPYTVLTTARCMDYVSSSDFVVVAGQKYSSSRGLVLFYQPC